MAATPDGTGGALVLYDGACGFCDRTVRFLASRDRHRRLRFAPLQGDTARRLRDRGLPIPEDLSTVVLVRGGRVSLRSRAVLEAMSLLPWPWRAVGWLRVVPAPLADAVYGVVARLRHRLLPAPRACPVPTDPERFLP